MDENNKCTVVAVKSQELLAVYFLMAAIGAFWTWLAIDKFLITNDVLKLIVASPLTVLGLLFLLFGIESLIRPKVVIRDFGNKFRIYYAFGIQRTFNYTDVDEFIVPHARLDLRSRYANFFIKVNKKTYRVGVIKDAGLVQMTMNSKRPYYPKQQL